jgi:hypothetical protein
MSYQQDCLFSGKTGSFLIALAVSADFGAAYDNCVPGKIGSGNQRAS